MANDVRQFCSEINRCNQRGGRMLSIVDLIEAATFTPELAAYSLAAISRGASFMVGALPGGAGKTSVMGALLNFVPPNVALAPADGMSAIQRGLSDGETRRCYICHEIGGGHWYAYLWDVELRAYFELPAVGHMLATNLHADTYDQARRQICDDNAVPSAAFRRMSLLYFLAVEHGRTGPRRRIVEVRESDGHGEHRRVFSANPPTEPIVSQLVSAEDITRARERIGALLTSGARTIEEVRAILMNEE